MESTTPLLAVREWTGHGALQGGSTGDAREAPVGGVLVPLLQPVRQPRHPTFGGCLRMPVLRIWAERPPEWCEEHVLARGTGHPCCGRAGEKTAERQSGPEGKRDEERPPSSHNVSLRRPFRVPPKPRTLVRGS